MGEEILDRTMSLCPECLKLLPATVFERDGKVFMKKSCPEHGEVEEIYWGNAEMYKKARSFSMDGRGQEHPDVKKENPSCPHDCGLCNLHQSHSALTNVVVTNRCDLNCWYCLPGGEKVLVRINGKQKFLPISEIAERFFKKGSQKISGGEVCNAEKTEVLSYDKSKAAWVKVSKIYRRKYVGKMIKIKTLMGKKITVTADHLVMIKKGNSVIRKAAEKLDKNDVILSVYNFDGGSNNCEIDLYKKFRKLPKNEAERIYVRDISDIFRKIEAKRITIKDFASENNFNADALYSWKSRGVAPLYSYCTIVDCLGIKPNGISFGVDAKAYSVERMMKITPELAKLIGYFVADGHYAKQNIWFTCKDTDVKADIEMCLKKLGYTYSILHYNKQKKATQIVVGNKILALVFKYALGIPAGAGKKRLPRQVFDFNAECKRSLLSGLFNGDGFVTRGEKHASVGLGSVSYDLIEETSYLLESVGVFPRIHLMSMKNNPLANYEYLYKLYIGSTEMLKFLGIVKLKDSHNRKLNHLTPRRKPTFEVDGDFILDGIKKIESSQYKSKDYVYDLQTESKSHSFVAGGGLLISNCFFYAEKAGYIYEPTIEQIIETLKPIREEKPIKGNAVQLTGGEPTIRDDLVDIVKEIKKLGFDHVQLNTDGIRLSKDAKLAKDLKAAGVNTLYLSFDGVDAKTNPKNHWEAPGVIKNCKEVDIGIVLVPTVIRTVNEHQIGDIVNFAADNIGVVRGVNFQPVSLVGRVPKTEREKFRITIPDVIEKLEEQTNGAIAKEDFYTVPSIMPFSRFVEAIKEKPQYDLSTHFACGMATYVFKDRGALIPITRFVDFDGFHEYLVEKTEEMKDKNKKNKYIIMGELLLKFNSFIDKKRQPKELNLGNLLYNIIIKHNYNALSEFHHKSLFIGLMHFQDLYNWDIKRVKKCCVHYATPEGTIPFCTFNVIPEWYRDKIQKKHSVSIEEWEKQTGRKLSDDLYRRKTY